jgi:hypothetical protein
MILLWAISASQWYYWGYLRETIMLVRLSPWVSDIAVGYLSEPVMLLRLSPWVSDIAVGYLSEPVMLLRLSLWVSDIAVGYLSEPVMLLRLSPWVNNVTEALSVSQWYCCGLSLRVSDVTKVCWPRSTLGWVDASILPRGTTDLSLPFVKNVKKVKNRPTLYIQIFGIKLQFTSLNLSVYTTILKKKYSETRTNRYLHIDSQKPIFLLISQF